MLSDETRRRIEDVIGYRFVDGSRLARAMTHASVATARSESYERLEFLGDAVLGLVVSEIVYHRYPDLLEGEMTKIKSAVVSRQTCAHIARSLALDDQLLLGKGMKTPARNGVAPPLPPSLAAAVLEAIIAAVYLDGGFEPAARLIRPLVEPLIERAALSGHQENFKSVLQQYGQQTLRQTPLYRVLGEKGPDHAKCFKIGVELAGRTFEPAWGQTKKQGEQLAALKALRELGQLKVCDRVESHLRSEPAMDDETIPLADPSHETEDHHDPCEQPHEREG